MQCDCQGHTHIKDAYFERNCAYCGCRKGTGNELSVYQAERICSDCGGPGLLWEDGYPLCNDCAILRAKKYQMDQERKRDR